MYGGISLLHSMGRIVRLLQTIALAEAGIL